MSMETLKLHQGSPEWKRIRGQHLVASEAPVIMGASPHMSRDELLFLKATGEEKEINEWVEKFVFKKGHDVEAEARPIAETRLGEELYPVTGARTVDGLPMLASFDGLTMWEDNHWEHKQYNKALFDLVAGDGELLPEHYWQLEHQMLVAGTDSCIFAVSDGTKDQYVECVYHSEKTRREQLVEGWKLFLSDLENYEPKVAEGELVGKGPMDLPALRIEIAGEVTASNLDRYRDVAMEVFESINTDLQTDDDFANAEKTVKWCQTVEDKLAAAKQHALSQTESIDELFRTIDDLSEEARRVRLNLDKKVTNRKKERKLEIAQASKKQFDEHIATLNKALGGDYMPTVPTDFNAAMKNKRTIATLEAAANDEFTRARIEANRIGSQIEENLELLEKEGADYETLFPDKKELVQQYDKKALAPIIKQRISDHKAAEEEKCQREENTKQTPDEPAANIRPGEHIQGELGMPAATTTVPADETAPKKTTATSRDARPSDDEIISALAEHFDADEMTVIGWLMEINIRGAHSQRSRASA